jgi:hypothetical protein
LNMFIQSNLITVSCCLIHASRIWSPMRRSPRMDVLKFEISFPSLTLNSLSCLLLFAHYKLLH